MRTRLLDAMGSWRPLQREHLYSIGERAIGGDGQHRDAAGGVVCDYQEAPAGVDRLVDAVAPTGIPAIALGQIAGLSIHGKRRSVALVAVDGIEGSLVAAEHQKGRID